jgi:nucleoside-diphosphate-sugar epimerase
MKVLVTGATGFIGEWVLKELDASEHTAVAFSGDVRDKSTFPKRPFEVIVHLAALVTHRQHQTAGDFYEVNVQGTKNLCEAYPSAKVIYVSTTDVNREQLSEYAKSKLEAEKVVEKQDDYAIIRLPSVFGPKQRQIKLIPLLFRKYCQNGECTIINNDLREYIYVGVAAKHIVDSIEQKGIITLRGFKIRDFDLDTMICAICEGDNIPNLTPEERYLFVCLEQCLPTDHEKTA